MTLTAAHLLRPGPVRAAVHTEIGDGHHVASPLGAWLLLALVAPAATGQARTELVEGLGVGDDKAAVTAQTLVRVAAAYGIAPKAQTDALTGWLGVRMTIRC